MILFGSAVAMEVVGYVAMAKNKLRFDEIGRTKGIEGRHAVAEDYARFMKALLVLVYRRRNRSISPAVAVATLMILKRWYHSLFEVTGQTHPVYLTTGVIQRSMDNLSAASSLGDPNTANYKGRCVSLQKLVNHQSFTLVTLQYVSDGQYTNQTNLTRKARETMALKQQAKLSDTTTDGEDALITIRGFLNIVALIQRVESDAEKIALNCLLLLVITGFRPLKRLISDRMPCLNARLMIRHSANGFRTRDYPIIFLVSVMLVSKVLGSERIG